MSTLIKKAGAYTLYAGGNVGGRGFYATGPRAGGEVGVLASFWNEGDGLRWVERTEAGDHEGAVWGPRGRPGSR
jgi:hypothetical protein